MFCFADLDDEDWILFDNMLKMGWTDEARAELLLQDEPLKLKNLSFVLILKIR